MAYDQRVYVSYGWGGESERIVNEVENDLAARGIVLVRDKKALEYRGSIREFEERIGRGACVVVVLSDKYLRSKDCMNELILVAENKALEERIFPIVLADADIYNPVNRLKYIKHWEDKTRELEEAMRTVGLANQQGIVDDLNLYTHIRNNIARMMDVLRDMNTLTPEMHEGSDFRILIDGVEKTLQKGSVPPTSTAPAAAPAQNGLPTPGEPSGQAARKILFLAAQPTTENQQRLGKEAAEIGQALRGAEFRSQFQLEKEFAVSAKTLQETLLRHKPNVLHFTGHGDENGILLEADDGQAQRVPPTALANLLALFGKSIQIVVLNGCYSAPQAEAIAGRIGHVIGMKEALAGDAARAFAAAFYQGLGYGLDVETAFELGVNQLSLIGSSQADAPILLRKAG